MANRRHWWTRPTVVLPVVVVGMAGLVLALAAFQPWRLFIDETVNEALPAVSGPAVVGDTGDAAADAAADPTADAASPAVDAPAAGDQQTAVPSQAERVVTASGEFISHEHDTSGQARVITLADGSRVLRLVDLDTDNGPDLKVWLAAAPVIEGRDGWFVFDDEEYLDLGALKGNKGNQNYPIPADADISSLTSVTIWCDRFSVSFGAAELTPA